jgi:hypothetical protein
LPFPFPFFWGGASSSRSSSEEWGATDEGVAVTTLEESTVLGAPKPSTLYPSRLMESHVLLVALRDPVAESALHWRRELAPTRSCSCHENIAFGGQKRKRILPQTKKLQKPTHAIKKECQKKEPKKTLRSYRSYNLSYKSYNIS